MGKKDGQNFVGTWNERNNSVQTQPTLRAHGPNEEASKTQVIESFLFTIGSAILWHTQKRDEHHGPAGLFLLARCV